MLQKYCACHIKRLSTHFCSFPHRHSDATGKPETPNETRRAQKNEPFVRDFLQFWHFRHVIKQVGMSQSAAPGTQNDMTPRKGFAASPLDTVRPRENQRLETRHVAAPKWAFRARIPPIFILCSFKIDVFQRVFSGTWNFAISQNRCFVQGFRQFSPHLRKCHACHGICTLSPLDAALPMRFAKARNTTRLKCCACHAKWRWTRPKCVAPATKTATHLRKTSQKYCACHTKPFSTRYKTRLNFTKCHTCHPKRSNETFETF